jgi:hypothetical protein
MVLLRGVDSRGFTFYTNYNSRKSREIEESGGKVAVCWYWKEISRQVRVVGTAEKTSKEESDQYFHSRPKGSQKGAHASEQSKEIEEGELQERVKAMEERYGDGEVPRPEHWGGWRIVPRYAFYLFLSILPQAAESTSAGIHVKRFQDVCLAAGGWAWTARARGMENDRSCERAIEFICCV